MELFFAHADSLSLFLAGLQGALYGLVLSLVVLFLGKRLGLFRRRGLWHGRLVKLYYLYLPLVFMLAGGSWLTATTLKEQALAGLETARPVITETSVKETRLFWDGLMVSFPDDQPVSVKELVQRMARESLEKEVVRRLPDNALSQTARNMITGLMSMGATDLILARVEEQLLAYAGERLALDKDTLHAFWSKDLNKVMENGLVMEILLLMFASAFAPLFSAIKTFFVLGLLPPVLETAVSLFLARRTARSPDKGQAGV